MRGLLLILKLAAAVAFLAGAVGHARADQIIVLEARLEVIDDETALSADFAFDLNPRLEQIVASGVPLYFLTEFELTRPRWYWFDEKAAVRSQHTRLSYHAISRQYRLSTGLLQQSFARIDDALAVLRRVRNWVVVERAVALSDADHTAAVRLRLDLSLLPKPFQVSALTSRELRLESEWRRFTYRPPTAGPESAPDKPEAAEKGALPAGPAEGASR